MNITASEPASGPWNPKRILAALRADASIGEVLAGADIEARYLNDWSGEEGGRPLALVRPHDTAEIARVMALCHAGRCPVVPQGGLTGLAGGATPIEGCVLVSLERMSGVVELDPASATMTVLAGTPLQVVQEAAQAAGFLFALDLGARGSCQIRGNIATNAGGNRVIRYGMARDLVLGLEAVLPDGTVLSMMNKMVKNNAGPDLKHLFIGTEGTLGIITQAVLRLHPGVSGANTALVAAPDFGSAIKLLRHAQHLLGGRVSAFEMMWQDYYAAATTAGGIAAPLPATYPLYVLLDLQAAAPEEDAARFEAMLEHALAEGWIADAAVAQSHTQTQAFWMPSPRCCAPSRPPSTSTCPRPSRASRNAWPGCARRWRAISPAFGRSTSATSATATCISWWVRCRLTTARPNSASRPHSTLSCAACRDRSRPSTALGCTSGRGCTTAAIRRSCP